MARSAFLLRIDPKLLEAVRQWADDELRSMNAQLEVIVRAALRDSGRLPKPGESSRDEGEHAPGGNDDVG